MDTKDKIRAAFRAGFWAWCGPANDAEYAEAVKDEQEAWVEWSKRAGAQDGEVVESGI